jgi:hypothetical protein
MIQPTSVSRKPSTLIGRALVIVTFFALIAFLALYLPIFNMDTSITGSTVTDYFHFHWNYWWIRHALTTPGLNVYETNYVMVPFTSNLTYHTLTVFWYPIWALIEPIFGTIAAMTAVFVVAFTLTGCTFFMLLRREGVSYGLALVGGTMLELSRLMFSAAYWTTTNIMGWFWLPLMLLTWSEIARTNRNPGKGLLQRPVFWTILFGIAFWAMVLTDIQYPLFLAFLIVPYGLLTLWRIPTWAGRGRLAALGVAALIIGLALLWFIGPLPDLLNFDRSGLAATPIDRAVRIKFPWDFISNVPIDEGVPLGTIYIPFMVIALIINWLQRKRGKYSLPMRWFWLALVPLPLILSPGAFINIGETQITLPYIFLHQLLGGMFRYPERFAPVFLIPGVLFGMMTLTPILKQYRWLRLALPTAFIFIVLADSRVLESVVIQPKPQPYHFYEEIGKEPYDYVVVEVPTGASSGEGIVGEQKFAALMYYGITHHKRMVNGHISRVNFAHFWGMRYDDPMLAWLGQRRFIEPDVVEQQLRERIAEWPIGYIVIHSDYIWKNGPTLQEVIGYLNSLPDLVCPMWIERDAIVYRTTWHPDGCPSRTPPETEAEIYKIDIGTSGDENFIGLGWHWQEDVSGLTLRWTGEYPQTQIYVDLPHGQYEVSLSAQAFWEMRELSLLLNDTPIGETQSVIVDTLNTYTYQLPAELVGNGRNLRLTLSYDNVIVPKEVGQSEDERKLAIAVDWIQFRRLGD